MLIVVLPKLIKKLTEKSNHPMQVGRLHKRTHMLLIGIITTVVKRKFFNASWQHVALGVRI